MSGSKYLIIDKNSNITVNQKNSQANTFFQIALAAHQQGNLIQAKQLYEQVLSIDNRHFDSLHLLGVIAYQMQDPRKSVQLISQALKISPNAFVAYNNLGLALQILREIPASIAVFKKSIELKNNNPEAFFNLGNSFTVLNDFTEALTHFNEAIRLNPNYPQAFNNRGNIFQELGEFDHALDDFNEAVKLHPRYDEAYTNRGNIFQELAQFQEALESYCSAITINPLNAEANWNKSLLLLLLGDYKSGLPLYEWRWRRENTSSPVRAFNAPLWLGKEDIKGKTILIHGEQGLGDSIQFCRYIKYLENLGARVILEDQKPLQNLFKNLEGVGEFIVFGDPLPRFDFHCPMLSLPLAFNTTYATVPDPTPYLFAQPEKVAYWKSKLGQTSKRRIGICWSSTSPFRFDGKRSMKLSEFIKLLPVTGTGEIEYVCLQKEIKSEDIETLASRADILFVGNDIQDFTDTAALIESCDEVISTCTSVPHLSAAMNKKTRILLSFVPDWRWGLHSNKTPYYKSVELIRQSALNSWYMDPLD